MVRRTRPTPLCVGVLLALALPAPGAAQRAAELPVGARVRVYPRGPFEPAAGVVVRASRDTLWVRHDQHADTAAIALDQLARVDLSRGPQPRARRGAGLGFVAGALAGALWGAASYKGCQAPQPCIDFAGSNSASATAGAVVVGAAGAVIGALVGAQVRREGWRPVPLERVGAHARPAGRGHAMAAGSKP